MKVSVSDLQFEYPDRRFSIHIPNLEVASGQSLAVIGPSGCGKTTFLNLLSALVTPQMGSIQIGDLELTSLTETKKRAFRSECTGYIFQDFGLIDYLTARDNILYTYLATGRVLPDYMDQELRVLANSFGITNVLNKKSAQISQGEKQRVAICRAMLAQPKIVYADEPTGNLDPENKAIVMDGLFNMAVEKGATLIVVTHDVDMVERFDQTLDFSQFRRKTL